jgi:hypothetical protein
MQPERYVGVGPRLIAAGDTLTTFTGDACDDGLTALMAGKPFIVRGKPASARTHARTPTYTHKHTHTHTDSQTRTRTHTYMHALTQAFTMRAAITTWPMCALRSRESTALPE